MSQTLLQPAALAPSARLQPKRASARPFGSRAVQPAQRRLVAAQAGVRIAATDDRFPRWDFMWSDLNRKGLESIAPEDAAAMVESGKAVVVDVRPTKLHEQAHPQGAVNAPVFQQVDLSAPSFGKLLKTAAMALNGVTPTEYNPRFLEQVAAAAAGGKAVILACEAGGTLTSSANFATGKASRSLKAAWKVVASDTVPAGRVMHLDGGVFRWWNAGLPMVGNYDPSNAGRTPAAASSSTDGV